jgi:hypothetical protein
MIEITAFGVPWLALCALLLAFRRDWLPALLPVGAVFQTPAVLIVPLGAERYGITPFNVACLAVALHLAALALRARRLDAGLPPTRRPLLLWGAFFTVCIVGALVLPYVFAGVPVHSLILREPVHVPPEPHRWTLSNLAQAINCFAVWLMFVYVAQRPARSTWRALAAGLGIALAVSLGVNAWQRAHMLGWVGMDLAFWSSNPGYNQYFQLADYGPSIGRAGLPFVEPSYASAWFAAASAAALALFLLDARWRFRAGVVLAASTLALLNTLGSSGLVAFVAFSATLVIGLMVLPRLAPTASRPWLLAIFATCGLGAAWLIHETAHGTSLALAPLRESVTWTLLKFTDQVTEYRTAAMRQGLLVAWQTWGMGAGAGSLRASSWFISLVANVGLPGLALFLAALAAQGMPLLRAARAGDVAAIVLAAGTVGLMFGIGAGVSDQNWPPIWAILLAGFAWLRLRDEPGHG